jgi:hypothetical protein
VIDNVDAIIQGQATASFGGARTTARLLAILGKLEKNGVPLLSRIISVEDPFPVAGLAYWVDDWHAYRCCPKPHLHQGVDMMAALGTPVLSVADGTITNKVNDPASSGLGLAVTDRGGTRYFYAHFSAFVNGLGIGSRVETGQIIGFVGNTGDASGGPTHLHFEVHPYGGAAVPPKPYVDRWLDQSEQRALRLVQLVTGKRVNLAKLDVSLWKNRLLQLAQNEIQAANVLSAKQAAAARAAQPKPKRGPGVDGRALPYALPVGLLALLAAELLYMDTRGTRLRSRRGDRPDEAPATAFAQTPEAIEIALALTLDVEAAFAESGLVLDADTTPDTVVLPDVEVSPGAAPRGT